MLIRVFQEVGYIAKCFLKTYCIYSVPVTCDHTVRHTHSIGLPWTSDRPAAEAATYTTHNKTRASLPSMGVEPAIPAIE
jgi:hypothetical protein